jgi:hypothetical protein
MAVGGALALAGAAAALALPPRRKARRAAIARPVPALEGEGGN